MSDVGEDFKAWHEHKKAKKHRNQLSSTELLIEFGIKFESFNSGNHLYVAERFDFWPSTGKWIERKTQRHGRGYRKLINALGEGE